MDIKTIKKIMIEKDITVTQLSHALYLSRQYVSMVINGKRKAKKTMDLIINYIKHC